MEIDYNTSNRLFVTGTAHLDTSSWSISLPVLGGFAESRPDGGN